MNLHLRVDFFFFDAILQYFVFTHIWTSYTLDLQQYRFITYIPPLYKECIFLFILKYVLHLIANIVLFRAQKIHIILYSHLYTFWIPVLDMKSNEDSKILEIYNYCSDAFYRMTTFQSTFYILCYSESLIIKTSDTVILAIPGLIKHSIWLSGFLFLW